MIPDVCCLGRGAQSTRCEAPGGPGQLAQSDRDAGRGDGGLRTAEREELNRLRRENRQLQLEREILSKAAAWFARETNVIPPKGSAS
jgi:transposase